MNSVNAPYSSQSSFSPTFDQNASNNPFGQQLGANGINPNSLDLLQYQSPAQEGGSVNHSPSPSQTPFQVPPVVPAKRGRQGDDVSASPRLPPGGSRSNTPQQFNQYAGQPGPQNFQTPTLFQQMQHVGSAHASPSPGPQNQMNSPRSFQGQGNPMAQLNQLQNQMGRMGTPQNAAQQSMMRAMTPGGNQNTGMDAGGMGNAFSASQGPGNMTPQIEAMRRQYQAQLARNQQQIQNVQQGGDAQSMMMRQQGGAWPGNANGQTPGRPVPPGATQPMTDAEKAQEVPFMQSLRTYQEKMNKPMNQTPRVCGQPISYWRLFTHYARINPQSNQQGWQALAASMGFPPAQHPTAPQELKQVFENDLKDFYFRYFKAMQMRRRQAGQAPGQGPAMPVQGSPTQRSNDGLPQAPAAMQFQQPSQASSPNMQMNQAGVNSHARPNALAAGTVNESTASVNGHRKSGSLFSNISTPDPIQQQEQQSKSATAVNSRPNVPATLSKPNADSVFDPQYQPRRRPMKNYGGLDIDAMSEAGSKIRDLKTYPRTEELGAVDLHVLNMCLLSGFHAETKYALDRLCALSHVASLRLWECEDLLESVIECGEMQVQKLIAGLAPSHDFVAVPNFHKVIKSGTTEIDTLLGGTSFGDADYQADHAIDRLLAVTTILRNLSFPLNESQAPERDIEANSKVLTDGNIRTLIVDCIKCLDLNRGTDMRTARNVQDLMKDLITILSNIADGLELSSEEEARAILELILAFAPSKAAGGPATGLELEMYNPTKHQYLPCAVDSLAKLLARDDPNRTHYRSILNADAHEQKPMSQLLITRAFSLALSPIPDSTGGVFSAPLANQTAERRRPFLSQGILAADILSTLMPSPASFGHDFDGSTSLDRMILKSTDGWASRLMRIIMALSVSDASMHPPRDRATGQVIENSKPFTLITQRGLSMLRRLIERADRAEREKKGGKRESISLELFATAPLESVLFTAMSVPTFDNETMKSLSALAELAN